MNKPTKRLVFGEGLLVSTLKGDKKIAIRRYRDDDHDFKKGEVIIGEFKEGLDVLIEITEDTETKPFSELTDKESREDGFKDAKDAFRGLGQWYSDPDLKKSDTAGIIRFKLFEVGGIKAVSINDYGFDPCIPTELP